MPQNALEHKNYKDAAQFPLFRTGCLHNGLTSSYSCVYIGIPRGCYFLSPRGPCQGVTVRIWLLLHYDVCTHYPMIYTGVPGGPRLPRVPTNFLWGTRTQLPLRLSYVWEVIKMRTVMNKMTNECLRCWIKVRGYYFTPSWVPNRDSWHLSICVSLQVVFETSLICPWLMKIPTQNWWCQ